MKNLWYIVFPLLGLVLTGISQPFIHGQVPPNSWSGFRTEKTRSNPEIWYSANRVMGHDLLIAGVVILVVSLLVLGLSRAYPNLPATKINVAVLLGSLACVALHSFWALSRM